MPDLLHYIAITATPTKVYAALTEQKGLSGWWTRDVKAEPKLGAIGQFRFVKTGFKDMKIVELVPGQRVKWQCVDDAKEWIGTELTFDLNAREGGTVLLFAQRGWREQVEFMHYCSTKWAVLMLSLKALCETGSVRPYPDDISIDQEA